MRFIHTSDWHLGRTLHARGLLEDQEHALSGLLATLAQAQPDALVIAGDIYDRAVPPADAVKLLNWFLEEAVLNLGIPTLIIAGNHDSGDRLGFAAGLLAQRGLHIAGTPAQPPAVLAVDTPDGPVHIYGLPFAEPAAVAAAFADPTLRDLASATRAQTAACLTHARAHGARAVVAAHGWVAGGLASESERPLAIGGLETIPADAFTGFSYAALGHLHRPQAVGAPHLSYSGSLLAYSFSEIGQEKSVCVVDVDASGVAHVAREPIQTKRRLREVRGSFAAVLEGACAEPERRSSEDYLLVTLEEPALPLEAAARLREVYPNVLAVQLAARAEGTSSSLESRRGAVRDASMDELFAAFWRDATGSELTDSLRERLHGALRALESDKADVAARAASDTPRRSVATRMAGTQQPEAAGGA